MKTINVLSGPQNVSAIVQESSRVELVNVLFVPRTKNPNFREMKREERKRGFRGFNPDNCRNQGIIGTNKGIFARIPS